MKFRFWKTGKCAFDGFSGQKVNFSLYIVNFKSKKVTLNVHSQKLPTRSPNFEHHWIHQVLLHRFLFSDCPNSPQPPRMDPCPPFIPRHLKPQKNWSPKSALFRKLKIVQSHHNKPNSAPPDSNNDVLKSGMLPTTTEKMGLEVSKLLSSKGDTKLLGP